MTQEIERAPATKPTGAEPSNAPHLTIPIIGPLRDLKPKSGDTVEIRVKGKVMEVTPEHVDLEVMEAGLIGSQDLTNRPRVRPEEAAPEGPPEATEMVKALSGGTPGGGDDLEGAMSEAMSAPSGRTR